MHEWTTAITSRNRTFRTRRARAAAIAIAAASLATIGTHLTAGASTVPDSTVPDSTGAEATIDAVASFYPLQFAAEQVGGSLVTVANLTPAGAEPHDLELTPRDAAALQDADLVVYLSGFAPALDDAVASLDADRVVDVAPAANLDLEGGEEEDHDHEEHADDTDAAEDDHDHEHEHGGVDPHFWLDPLRLADVADAIAARFGELDADHADEFTANAATLRGELEALDAEYRDGLAECANTDIVTSHTAFGYLAERYGLTQVGISGLSPDEEPSPARLAEVTEFVQDHDVTTIYYETLVDPAIAEAVAAETGAQAAVLDPIEGLTDDSAGSDYFEVMRSNLEALRAGQDCA